MDPRPPHEKVENDSRSTGRMRAARLRNFLGEISREISRIPLLQFRALPVFASQTLRAIGRFAFAFYRVIIIIGSGPIVSELFARSDITHCHECNLAAHSE